MHITSNLNLLVLILLIHLPVNGQVKSKSAIIDPTGSYKLNNKTVTKNGETYGYFGHVEVKLLQYSKIAINLYVCKGATSYNSGGFLDTLNYQNNTATYTTTEYDSTCRIILTFKKTGITIEQNQANLNNGCGFGHGVFADGYYRKISSKVPVITDEQD